VAQALASIDLVILCVLTLSILLLETPVPRAWALPTVGLLTLQTWALYMLPPPEEAAPHRSMVESPWEAVAALAVPALTAALLTVVFYYCARAYAAAKRRFEASQAIGRDIPTG
jgi:hypothetical protein